MTPHIINLIKIFKMKYLLILILTIFYNIEDNNPKIQDYRMPNNCDSTYISRDIYFKVGTANLDLEKSSQELNRIAEHIIKCNIKFEISVHIDNRYPTKSSIDITVIRAINIKNTLVSLGVEERLIAPIGKGYSEPIIKEPQNESDFALNRRVEIRPLGE
jgi:outer membrane protein OmpA-like peptidoglycan-associated protein